MLDPTQHNTNWLVPLDHVAEQLATLMEQERLSRENALALTATASGDIEQEEPASPPARKRPSGVVPPPGSSAHDPGDRSKTRPLVTHARRTEKRQDEQVPHAEDPHRSDSRTAMVSANRALAEHVNPSSTPIRSASSVEHAVSRELDRRTRQLELEVEALRARCRMLEAAWGALFHPSPAEVQNLLLSGQDSQEGVIRVEGPVPESLQGSCSTGPPMIVQCAMPPVLSHLMIPGERDPAAAKNIGRADLVAEPEASSPAIDQLPGPVANGPTWETAEPRTMETGPAGEATDARPGDAFQDLAATDSHETDAAAVHDEPRTAHARPAAETASPEHVAHTVADTDDGGASAPGSSEAPEVDESSAEGDGAEGGLNAESPYAAATADEIDDADIREGLLILSESRRWSGPRLAVGGLVTVGVTSAILAILTALLRG